VPSSARAAAAILISGFIALAAALADDGTSLVFAQVVSRGGSSAPDGPTIQAVGYGRASAPAEAAQLQILVIPFDGGPGGPISSGPTPDATPGAQEPEEPAAAVPLVAALVTAGIPREAIRVVVSPALNSGFYGPGAGETFRLDVALDGGTVGDGVGQPDVGEALAAGGGGVDRVEGGAELGALLTVEDGPTPPSGAGACGAPAADRAALAPYGPQGISLPDFDPGAPAEVTVAIEVRTTFAIPQLEG
jgi:hypothetical protein